VLFHDAGGERSQTIKALPTYIKKMKAAGYTFTTRRAGPLARTG
jgi:peptidoglycan/xylan/chitin deacetylase (PgdA/CDA1 family)